MDKDEEIVKLNVIEKFFDGKLQKGELVDEGNIHLPQLFECCKSSEEWEML